MLTGVHTVKTANPEYSAEEWQTRVDLAATYHLLRKYRMTDLTNQHGVARVEGGFLTQHYGMMNEEVTASNLVKSDWQLNNLEPYKGEPGHAAAHIARALLTNRPEINCYLHIHTREIMSVSCQRDGVQPYSQAYLMIGGSDQIAYSRYEFDCSESYTDALVSSLSGKMILIERFHGAFVLGRSVAEAFFRAFYLSQACNVQLTAQSAGVPLVTLTPQEIERNLKEMQVSDDYVYDGSDQWPALLRMLDRESPSYASCSVS